MLLGSWALSRGPTKSVILSVVVIHDLQDLVAGRNGPTETLDLHTRLHR